MTSKLPVRRNIAPSFKIASNLENLLEKTIKPSKGTKIYKKFSANFNGQKSVIDSDAFEADADSTAVAPQNEDQQKINRHNWKAMVSFFFFLSIWEYCSKKMYSVFS